MLRAEIRPELRFAWRGPTMWLVDWRGEASSAVVSSGLWFRETRYLRRWQLRINGRAPHLCAIGSAGNDQIEVSYVHPELGVFGGGGSGLAKSRETFAADGISHRGIDLRAIHRVELDGLETRIVITNRTRHPASLEVEVGLGADWADLVDTLGEREPAPRAHAEASAQASTLELRFAHPALPYVTRIEAPGARATPEAIRWTLALAPRDEATLAMRVRAVDFEHALSGEDLLARDDALAKWRAGHVAIESRGSGAAPLVIEAALADFASLPLLEGTHAEWLAPQAGVPIYPALFGRDALTAAWHASFVDGGAMLDAALTRLGRLQGARVDPRNDEQPGRIPQQVRLGPRARLGESSLAVHYADVASPLMYVVALAQLYGVRGERRGLLRHLDVARRVLDWARERGDADGDGFLEYETRSREGPEHQGWKDSGDAIVHADGSNARAPIATCEVQAYWFAAQQLLAIVLWLSGRDADARAYWASARELKARFHASFWMEDEGFYGLALDRDKRLLRSVTSNVGHCLAAGIVARSAMSRVVDRMFAPDLWSGWGFRTLSSRHPGYNPLSYHRGSVWMVESATIALGLRRFGYDDRALQIADAALELAALYPGFRAPECVGGYARDEASHPGAYPRAGVVQAWNVSGVLALVHAMLGLFNVAPLDLLAIDPLLPRSLDALTVRGLRVGRGRIDVEVWRDRAGRTRFEVTKREGILRVVHQPPPESTTAGLGDRMRALLEGVRS